MKKILGTLLLVGGPVACAKSCTQRCQDQNSACGVATDCATVCGGTCAKQNEAFYTCAGTDCSCTSAGSLDACDTFLASKCLAEWNAAAACSMGA